MPPPPPNFDDDFGGEPIVRKKSTVKSRQGRMERLSDTAGNGTPPATSHQPPTTIFVEISAQGNWQQTFKQSLEIAGTFSGNDHLHIKLAEQPNLTMSFPNNPTKACDALLGRLRKLTGVVDAKIT
jgi:hypothetical protein